MFCHKLHGYIRNHQAWHWVLEDYASIILEKIGASEYQKLCWKIGSLFYQIRKVGTTSAYLCIKGGGGGGYTWNQRNCNTYL